MLYNVRDIWYSIAIGFPHPHAVRKIRNDLNTSFWQGGVKDVYKSRILALQKHSRKKKTIFALDSMERAVKKLMTIMMPVHEARRFARAWIGYTDYFEIPKYKTVVRRNGRKLITFD